MATYPTGAPSFSAKTSGQTIAASHINDLQDEVAAIGDALVNAKISHDLTPSTNSTRSLGTVSNRWRTAQITTVVCDRVESTSLDVTGDSTLNSSLTVGGRLAVSSGINVGGASSFTGAVTVGGVLAVSHDAVRVQTTAVQAVAANGNLSVQWTNQVFTENSSVHSTATNSSRVAPQSTGIHLFQCGIVMSGPGVSTGQFQLRILDSSGNTLGDMMLPAGATTRAMTIQAVGSKRFNSVGATNWVRVQLTNANESTNSIAVGNASFFSMYRL